MTNIATHLNTVSFNGMINEVMLGIDIDRPTIFLGTYGIGKSAGIKLAGERCGYAMVDFRAGEILPEDVGGIGVPVSVETAEGARQIVERAVPDILQKCVQVHANTGKPVLLFLDEITSAPPAVQAALFQVLLDRTAGGYRFPDGTRVVAAGNLATDRSIVEELARPLLNRAMVYHYTGPNAEEFEAYAKEVRLHPVVRTFLNRNTAYVCDKINPEHEQSPTPRSWETASAALSSRYLMPSSRMATLAACVGDETAAQLEAFLDTADKLVPFAEIMAAPNTAQVPNANDFAACYMTAVALSSGVSTAVKADKSKAEEIVDAMWTYIKRLPTEIACVTISDLHTTEMTVLLTRHQKELMYAEDGAYAKSINAII